MGSKRRYEGVVTVDHRDSPGISESLAIVNGMPIGATQGFFEAPAFGCNHCQAVVVMNPLRNRERAYCTGCDHYLCDKCGAARAKTGVCRPYIQFIDNLQERDTLALQRGSIILPT